jgi:hypothetical protein
MYSTVNRAANEAFLASCTEEQRGGITLQYFECVRQTYPYLFLVQDYRALLPALPKPIPFKL